MSEFFEPPAVRPEPPRRERTRTPPWLGAPRGTLPGVLPVALVLARTEQVAVCLTGLVAYPEGFEFDLLTMAGEEADDLDPLLFEGRRLRHRRNRGGAGEIPEGMLRFGVEFADGRKATNTADPLAHLGGGLHRFSKITHGAEAEQAPAGPVLQLGGGGGGGGNWRQSVWIWPLPPPGTLTFVCQWPEAAIALTRHEVQAQPLLDAAARAQVIFPEAEDGEESERSESPEDGGEGQGGGSPARNGEGWGGGGSPARNGEVWGGGGSPARNGEGWGGGGSPARNGGKRVQRVALRAAGRANAESRPRAKDERQDRPRHRGQLRPGAGLRPRAGSGASPIGTRSSRCAISSGVATRWRSLGSTSASAAPSSNSISPRWHP